MKNAALTSETNLNCFSKKLSNKIQAGFKIVEYNEKLPYAVLTKEHKNLNHSFHFALSILTIGVWLVVWIYLTLTHIPKKEILIAIDEDGNVFEEKCVML